MARGSLKNISKLIDAANKQLTLEEEFLNDLKASIEKVTEIRLPSQTIKPSSFNCIRNAYYQLVGAEPTIPTRNSYIAIGICESGTDRHIRMQQNIEKMKDILGVDCEYINVADFVKQRNLTDIEVVEQKGMETKLYNKRYNMSFMCDGIVRYKGKYFIFEFKTESSSKFYRRTGVDESHYNQAIAYSLNFKLDNVLFIYECRDMLDLKAYMFNVTEGMRNTLVMNIEATLNFAQSKEVPPIPNDVAKKTCSYCQYKNLCEEDG